MHYYVYILASKRNGTLYIGMTGDLAERMMQHKQKYVKGFTQRYDIYILVYAEAFERVEDAQANEYRMKRWRRAWKLELIESRNPDWVDLSYTL
ncbi:MAG: GIY-YIG nuclease family protein [Pseudomonadota bacterium]